MTAVVAATLQQFPQMTSIATAVSKASGYLLAHQNSDGSFGSPATPYETALAYIALVGDGQTQGLPLQNAVNFLTATQSANGSWNDDPYSTALAIRALHFSENRPAPPPPAPAAGTITGTVIDSVTQVRVGGVAVTLAGNSLLNTTTDSSGNFTLADVPPGEQSVHFAKPGYAARSASAAVSVGATTSLGYVPLISSQSTGTIAGTITDTPGKPLGGVAVSVSGAWSGSAVTGADGSYSIPYVTPGEVTVTASKTGWRSVAATAMVYARTTLSFSPSLGGTPSQSGTGTLVGRVIDSYWGVPIAPLEGEQGVRITLSNGAYAEPDSGGYFTISGIAPNTYQVIVGVDGTASQSFRVAIPAGAVIDLGTIRLESTISEMTLTGKVTDAVTGAPIPGAELTVSGSGLTGRTDFAGVYAIADIDHPSEFTLKVSANGYVGKSFTVGSSTWLESMDVALTRQATKGSLAGAVVDAATGEPIGGATLTSLSDPARSAVTSGAGAFSIAEVPQGMQQVRIAATGYTARVMTTAVTAGTVNNVGRIPLSVNESAASIQGTVWDAVANAPFAGVAIESAAAALPQTSSAADGGYRFDNVTPGEVTVEAAAVTRTGYYPARLTGTVEPGGILVFNPILTTAAPTAVDLSIHSEPSYRKGDTVGISVLLNNREGAAYSTRLRVKILDPSGAAIFEEGAAFPLPADGALARDFSATLPASVQGGEYTITAQLFDEGGRIIGAGRRSFAVATSRIAVTPLLPAAFAAGGNQLAFKLVNTGDLPVQSGTLRVTLKEPDGREVAAASPTFALGLGEERTITATLSVPPLKFGTYTLSYSQSDETVNGLPKEIALPNSVAITALYDSNSHRVRNSAGLTVVVANTGRFTLAAAGSGLPVAVAVPDAAYEETKTLVPAPAVGNSAGSTLLYSFVIPETMTAAQHGTRITVALPSGSGYTQNAQLSIPESSLSVQPLQSAYSAGEVMRPVVANDGGVDTTVEYRFSLFDARSELIAESAQSGTVLAGGTLPVELAVPAGAVDGNYRMEALFRDRNSGKDHTVTKALTINGVRGSLQLRTDKERYTLTESITALSGITNSGSELSGGELHLEVSSGVGVQKTKTWTTQAEFQGGRA